MALDLHPAHAQASGESPAHSHFGATCDTPEFEKVPLDGSEITSSNYADCVHHCPILHRAATEHRTTHDSGALAMASIESYRQTFSVFDPPPPRVPRSAAHTSELQSLMRISYAVFCLNKK